MNAMNSSPDHAHYRLLRYDSESPDARPDGKLRCDTLAEALRAAADLSENGNGVYQVSLLYENCAILTFFPEVGTVATVATARAA